MFKLRAIAFTSHVSKVMLKILQARLQQYLHQELPDVMYMLGLEKGEGPEIKLPTYTGSSKKQDSSRKTSTLICIIDYTKAFDCVDHNKLWKLLEEMGLSPASWETCR